MLRPAASRLQAQQPHRQRGTVWHGCRPRACAAVRSRRPTVACKASWIPDLDLDDIISVGAVAGSCLAILGTAALAIRTAPPPGAPPKRVDEDEGSQYGVMAVVSLIPLVNWTVCTHVMQACACKHFLVHLLAPLKLSAVLCHAKCLRLPTYGLRWCWFPEAANTA
jgi:hypothetical protein